MRGKAAESRPGDFGKRAVVEAKKQGVAIEGESMSLAEQQRLLEKDGAPAPSVQNGAMLSKFVRPHFDMEKDKRFVALEFSIALSDAHKSLIDSEVLDAWKFIDRHHPKGIIGIEIPPQTIDLYLAPDDDAELHLTSADITAAKLSLVERNGDGKTEKVTRLQFRVVSEISKNIAAFAVANYGVAVWIKMQAAQGVLAAD